MEGWKSGGWAHAAPASPCRPAWLSAHISHYCPKPLCLYLFSFLLSVTLSFSQRSLSICLYFSLPLPISLVHSCSCNPIVLLENSLFLNWIERLSSQCFDRVLSSYAHIQWIVKETVKTDWSSCSIAMDTKNKITDSWYLHESCM